VQDRDSAIVVHLRVTVAVLPPTVELGAKVHTAVALQSRQMVTVVLVLAELLAKVRHTATAVQLQVSVEVMQGTVGRAVKAATVHVQLVVLMEAVEAQTDMFVELVIVAVPRDTVGTHQSTVMEAVSPISVSAASYNCSYSLIFLGLVFSYNSSSFNR
jgi:hypothetical protein